MDEDADMALLMTLLLIAGLEQAMAPRSLVGELINVLEDKPGLTDLVFLRAPERATAARQRLVQMLTALRPLMVPPA